MKSLKLGFLIVFLGTQAACLQQEVSDQGTDVDVVPDPVVAPDPSQLVCDPFASPQGGDSHSGLKGRLYYVPPGGPQYPNVADYIASATEVPADLFFNQLFVPTRPFDRGFVTQSGETLKAADGQTTLYEWFGIRFQSQLQLGPQDAPGAYQLALLSDDGAVLDFQDGDLTTRVVDNDGWHPTRLGCSTVPVTLGPNSRLPFTLDYFQGPRFHIALVALWRPWPVNPNDVTDPLCGRQGNGFWFNFAHDPPTPTANYQALLARGWRVLTPDNFRQPEAQGENPCNDPAPVLSNLRIEGLGRDRADVVWDTDRPATREVQVRNLATGDISTTNPERTMLTSHRVVLTGLTPNTVYEVTPVSRSSSGLATSGGPISFRTRR